MHHAIPSPEHDEPRLFSEEEFYRALRLTSDEKTARREAREYSKANNGSPRFLPPLLLDLLLASSESCVERIAQIRGLSVEETLEYRSRLLKELEDSSRG